MYEFEFTIPGLPPTTNSHGRAHWTVKAKLARKWRDLVVLAVGSNKPSSPLLRAKLTLTRGSSADLDPDGLVSSFKHIVDGLIDAGVIANDRTKNIGFPTYNWEQCAKKNGFIRVHIQELAIESA